MLFVAGVDHWVDRLWEDVLFGGVGLGGHETLLQPRGWVGSALGEYIGLDFGEVSADVAEIWLIG